MAFIGIGKKKLSTEAIGSNCPSCNSDEMMMVDIYARYFALLWIPVFPLGKEAKITCPKCGHKPELSTLPTSFFLETEQMKNILSSPGYLFTGSVLILLAVVFFAFRMISGISNPETDTLESYLNSPEEGDVYEIKTDNGNYSLLKVVEITDDSLYVQFHPGETEDKSEIKKLRTSRSFSREIFSFSREQIIINYESGLILNIERVQNEEEDLPVSGDDTPNKSKNVTPAKRPEREPSGSTGAAPAGR